jgi:hypothetical protein
MATDWDVFPELGQPDPDPDRTGGDPDAFRETGEGATVNDDFQHVNASALIEDGDRALYAQAARHFPTEDHKTEMRGGAEITYAPGDRIITRLNETFVYGWESVIVDDGINEDADECWARVRLTVWRKATIRSVTVTAGEQERTTYSEQLVPISREQYGSQKLKRARSTGRILDIGFDKKGAATDALKKAATLFGVALYLSNAEERAMIQALQKEQQQEQRAQAQNTHQDDAPQGTSRFKRPTRPGTQNGQDKPSEPAPERSDGALVINGVKMPEGFQQPFALVDVGKSQNQCRAEECATVVNPNGDYKIGEENKKGGYVMKRSREEAGCVLCVSHTAQWYRAKQAAIKAAAAPAA